jgi:hypothetical protein
LGYVIQHIQLPSYLYLLLFLLSAYPPSSQPSDQSLTSSSGELSVGTTPNSASLLSTSYPPSKSGEALLHSHLKRGSSQDIPIHSHSNHTALMSRTDTEVCTMHLCIYNQCM